MKSRVRGGATEPVRARSLARQRVVVHHVDVFTRTPLAGNPAAVVLRADGLSDSTMLRIAREMNLSETAFVFADRTPGVVPVRFFTPECEIPACGHATLAAQWVRASALGLEEGRVIQETPGARWEVRWEPRCGAPFVVMRQGPVRFGAVWDEERTRDLVRALKVEPDALVPDAPVQEVSTGHPKVMVPIATPAALAAIQPDLEELARLSHATGIAGYFLFAPTGEREVLTECRMFAPAIGIAEDPVNGSGHGPLAAYLLARGNSPSVTVRDGFWSRMGDHLGRPGRVWVHPAPDGRTIEVGGHVVPGRAFTRPLDGSV